MSLAENKFKRLVLACLAGLAGGAGLEASSGPIFPVEASSPVAVAVRAIVPQPSIEVNVSADSSEVHLAPPLPGSGAVMPKAVEGGVTAQIQATEAVASEPTQGEVKAPVFCVQFPDRLSSMPAQTVIDRFAGATDSVTAYFRWASQNRLTFDFTTCPYGWVTAAHYAARHLQK